MLCEHVQPLRSSSHDQMHTQIRAKTHVVDHMMLSLARRKPGLSGCDTQTTVNRERNTTGCYAAGTVHEVILSESYVIHCRMLC